MQDSGFLPLVVDLRAWSQFYFACNYVFDFLIDIIVQRKRQRDENHTEKKDDRVFRFRATTRKAFHV